ncbi:hypothetical protein L249_2353 [Ophiocordyceps polyrhachis-furcata BCC 54312]|uniref:Nucleolar protein 2 n=1 Tax=Ophiocordyceps polyrhachis-furcata BCC 54312 TaxID=1330021 RepID=A0A367LP62_9HYPO|nr:hypothetical protein L249_2353 [Ophiocordyceps polyrhachis-furcata BCC 54312]
MGAGRRMSRKQGPPEALSEEHFARLKRKAGLPVEVPEKRRKTTAKNSTKKEVVKGSKKMEKKPASGRAAAPKYNGKPKGKKVPVVDLSPSPAELDDEFDLEEAEEETKEGKNDQRLGTDFLGSESDSGSSVFDSGDEQNHHKQHVFSEDEDESDAEAKLTAANMESLSRKLDRRLADEAMVDAAEMAESALQTNIAGEEPPQVLEDEDDGAQTKPDAMLAPDMQLLRTRMTETVRVLDDMANLGEDGRSRSEYTTQLIKDICAYYGYSEFLAKKLYHLFSPREALAFFEANESPRPVVIRTNTLRTHRRDLAQALINRGVTLEPVGKWSKVGLQVFESSVPLGATPEYLAGHYILQAASSFLPCMALDPQENERVLDMAAAPGGKTTYMAAMMKNSGVIVANDANKVRAKGLIGNIHRLGATNVIVCSYDAREFPKPMGGFDRVLLDAPCSGTGVIAKDASVKTNKTELDFMQLPHMQKQLLLAAIDSANHSSRSGGSFIVYSTCSVTIEENEQVVNYALSRRPNVRLVETGLPFGAQGFSSHRGKKFHPSLGLTRRYYPHAYNVDGFYVAKFKKLGPFVPPPPATSSNKADEDSVPFAAGLGVETVACGADDDGPDGDSFGGWHEEEDREYIEKGRRNAMRRRGLDPRGDKKKASSSKGAKEVSNKGE